MATLTEEDERALAWQVQQRKRRANEQAQGAAMTGNAAAAQRVHDAWAPVILARQEAQAMEFEDSECEDNTR